MSDWGFVSSGWILAYCAIAAWFYFSRSKKLEK